MSSEKNGGDDHGGHDTSEKHLLTSPVDRFLSDRLKDCLRSASLADIHFVTDDGTVKAHQVRELVSSSSRLRKWVLWYRFRFSASSPVVRFSGSCSRAWSRS